MRRSGFFLPALSMGLLYASMYMGLILINLRGSARDGRGDLGILLHFALLSLALFGLYFAARKGIRRLRPLAAILALAGLFFMAVPFLPGDLPAWIFNARPPVIGLGMALFTPVALFLFFRAAPAGREGFSFSLIILCGELLWALSFPLLGGIFTALGNRQGFHLFALNCWLLGGAGLCLGAALAAAASDAPGGAILPGGAARRSALQVRKKRAASGLIFAAGAGVFGMTGLHMGFMPKVALMPELLDLPYFLLLFLLPPAGRMLDGKKPGALLLLCIFGCAAIPFLGLAQTHGLISRISLFYPLGIMQQVMLLAVYTTAVRLFKTQAIFLFMLIPAHCLYLMQFVGVALRGLAGDTPYGLAALSLLSVLGTSYCLWRFRRLLDENPALWALPQDESVSALQADYTAFGLRFGLSEREILVMNMLAQGRPTEAISVDLKVTESTIRTYISRILRKTGAKNRAELLKRASD